MKTGVDHAENFPVASWLCPPELRPAVAAIYWFARTADDLADEGDAPAAQRLADLAAYREQLALAAQGLTQDLSPRWQSVFAPLAQQIGRHQLPIALLADLLSAFEQDVRQTAAGQWYATHDELMAYCMLSANPVGRLLLHLYGITDPVRLAQSDCICTALQLINFWQDLSVDIPRRRHYLPVAELLRYGLCSTDFLPDIAATSPERDGQRAKVVAHLLDLACDEMDRGAPLALALPGRMGWELRLVIQGGLRVAEKIGRMGHRTWRERPALGKPDMPLLLWRAWRMV